VYFLGIGFIADKSWAKERKIFSDPISIKTSVHQAPFLELRIRADLLKQTWGGSIKTIISNLDATDASKRAVGD
jgi:hypothetical protein